MSDYSSVLRQERINRVLDENVGANDWVIHADLDEFHIYPQPLPAFVRMCEDHGYTFVQGKWADRLALEGDLPPIELSPSIWEQFPLEADLSLVSGGIPYKVCIAKGYHRSRDGGTHSLDFGFTIIGNLEEAERRADRYPEILTIDHFNGISP